MTKPILAAILSCSGPELTDDEKFLFAKANPLGITLFDRNIQSKEQLSQLVQDIKNTINRDDVLIAIDEEGGRVSRLKQINHFKCVSAETLGKSDCVYCEMQAEIISSIMIDLGININYAPVVDKITAPQNPVLMSRCLSSDEEKIVKYARKMADAYIKNGICPCIKHIPTHFAAQKDPHLHSLNIDLPLDEIKRATLYLKEFSIYPLAMTSHIKIDAIDDIYPVTMSKKAIIDFLRGFLNYNGFLISDAIDMHALKGKISERASLCLDAGIDAICYCSGIYKDLYEICEQKRFMTEKSLIRFAKIKNIIHNPNKDIDVANIYKCYIHNFSTVMEEQYAYDATEVLNQMLTKGENL